MIRLTRRGALAGALAVPTVAGLAHWRWRHGERSVLLHDPALEAGRRFAAAGAAQDGEVRAIEGDRIRFARALFERQPALVAGVSRHVDALMIEEVAREASYARVAMLQGTGNCYKADCRSGWAGLGRLAEAAGGWWIEALANYALDNGRSSVLGKPAGMPRVMDPGVVVAWVLTPRL